MTKPVLLVTSVDRPTRRTSEIVSPKLNRVEELGVRAELVERLEQSLHRLDRLERVQSAAELLHLLVLVLAEELLFLARPGGLDVDGREDALFRKLAVEVDLAVSGALELLEDHFVHAG